MPIGGAAQFRQCAKLLRPAFAFAATAPPDRIRIAEKAVKTMPSGSCSPRCSSRPYQQHCFKASGSMRLSRIRSCVRTNHDRRNVIASAALKRQIDQHRRCLFAVAARQHGAELLLVDFVAEAVAA